MHSACSSHVAPSQVIMLSSVTELHSFIDRTQLTQELGGTQEYCHEKWISHRTVSPVTNTLISALLNIGYDTSSVTECTKIKECYWFGISGSQYISYSLVLMFGIYEVTHACLILQSHTGQTPSSHLSQAIEGFALMVKMTAQALQSFGTELAETELPRDIQATKDLLDVHTEKKDKMKVSARSTMWVMLVL